MQRDAPGTTDVTKPSVPVRVLLFATFVAVALPLGLWLIVQFYEWGCTTWITCEPMGKKP